MMIFKNFRPSLSGDYISCARAYALDIASSLILFCCTSIMVSRVWRFPFDDEIYTPSLIENNSAIKVVLDTVDGDVHPPLSYLLFLASPGIG